MLHIFLVADVFFAFIHVHMKQLETNRLNSIWRTVLLLLLLPLLSGCYFYLRPICYQILFINTQKENHSFSSSCSSLFFSASLFSIMRTERCKNGIWCMSANAWHRTIFWGFTCGNETTVAGFWCSRMLLTKQRIST